MQPDRLSDSAELALQLLCLGQQDEAIVRNCIGRYSAKPNSVSEQIKQLFYFVMEEMRTKWGTSDLQQSEKIISKKMFKVLPPLLRNEITYLGAAKAGELGMSMLMNLNTYTLSIPKPIHNFAVAFGNIDVICKLLNGFIKDKAPVLMLEPKQLQGKIENMAATKAREITSAVATSVLDTIKSKLGLNQPAEVPLSSVKKVVDVTKSEKRQQLIATHLKDVKLAETGAAAA